MSEYSMMEGHKNTSDISIGTAVQSFALIGIGGCLVAGLHLGGPFDDWIIENVSRVQLGVIGALFWSCLSAYIYTMSVTARYILLAVMFLCALFVSPIRAEFGYWNSVGALAAYALVHHKFRRDIRRS